MALGIIEPMTDEKTIPGTELLVESVTLRSEDQHYQHAKGRKADIVLIPQPSDDVNDPLRWAPWKREAAFFFLFFNCIVFAACPGPMIAPATVALSLQLEVSFTKISQLSGYQLLIVGALGPFVSVLAQKYGKRPQFLLASVFGIIGTGICISSFSQSSLARSYNVLLAGRMVQGIGTTAYESLSVAAIGDMFFLHERGLRTALLVLTLACLSSFVAIIAGPLFEHSGARNLFVVLLPVQILGALGGFLLLPETQYRRAEADWEKDNASMQEKNAGSRTRDVGGDGDDTDGARRGLIQELRVTSGVHDQTNFFKLLGEIFIHLLNPAVLWIQLVSAILISFFVGTAYTIAQIFSPPPYALTVSQNGYFFTGALVGGILGILAGPLCDLSARLLAKRNGGVFEAEFRIPVCILAVVMFTVGWFVFGWALDHPERGYGMVYLSSFCYGAVAFGTSVASTSAGLYILDAFRAHATEIFILQMMIKNFVFYSFSTFVNDFAAKSGPGHMVRVFGIVTICGFTTCIPMYIFGKKNRVWMHQMWKRYLNKN